MCKIILNIKLMIILYIIYIYIYIYILAMRFIADSRTKFRIKDGYKDRCMIAKSLNHNRCLVHDICGFNVTAKPYNSIHFSNKSRSYINDQIYKYLLDKCL